MHIKHKIKIPSYSSLLSLSSYFSETWLKHSKIFKRKSSTRYLEKQKSNVYLRRNYICNISSDLRNASSIELEELLNTTPSYHYHNKKYNSEKPADGGDCLNLGTHDINYNEVLVRKGKNKACMCKPVGKVVVSLEQDKKKIKPECTNPKCKINENKKPKKICCQCPKPKKEKRICVPRNFEQLLKESGNEKIKYSCCKSGTSCGCQTYDTQAGLKKGLNLPGGNICMQKSKPPENKDCCGCNQEKPKSCKKEKKYCLPPNYQQIIKTSVEKIKFPECKGKNCSCQTLEVKDGLKKGLPGDNICVQKKESLKGSTKGCCACSKSEKPKTSLSCSNTTCPNKKPKKKLCGCCRPSGSTASVSSKKSDCFPCCKKKEKPPCKPCKKKKACCGCFRKKKASSQDISTVCKVDKVDQICQRSEVKLNDSSHNIKNVKSIWLCSTCGKMYSNSCKKCNKGSTRNTILPKRGSSAADTDTIKKLIEMEAEQNYKQINNILHELTEQKNEIKRLSDMYQDIARSTRNAPCLKDTANRSYSAHRTRICCMCQGYGYDFDKNKLDIKCNNIEQCYPHDQTNYNECNRYPKADNDKQIKDLINKSKSVIYKRMEIKINPRGIENEVQAEPDIRFKRNTNSVLTLFAEDRNVRAQVSKTNLLETGKLDKEYEKCHKQKCQDSPSKSNAFINWCKKSFTSLKENKNQQKIKQESKSDKKSNTMVDIICNYFAEYPVVV